MSRVSLFWSRVLGPTVARYGWYLVVIPLVLANLGAFQAATAKRVYESTTTLTVGNTLVDLALGAPDTTGTLLLNRELVVALSSDTISKVTMKPGVRLSARLNQTTSQLALAARASQPVDAQAAANSFAKAYVAESARRRLSANKGAVTYLSQALTAVEKDYAAALTADDKYVYQQRANDLRVRLLTAREGVAKPTNSTVEQDAPASFPTSPTNRSPLTAAVLGFVFGLGICGVIILVLDFGEKQRVSLDDICDGRPDLRVLGVSRPRNLRSAALVGHAIRTNAATADARVVCAAFVGARVRPGALTTALVSAIRLAGGRCVQVLVRETGRQGDVAIERSGNGVWTLSMPDSSYAFDAGDLLHKAVDDEHLDLAVIQGPYLGDNRARPAAFQMADQIALVIDAVSTGAAQVKEGFLVVEAFDRPVLGALFLQR